MMTIVVTGSKTLCASRETVWAALNDADSLRFCVPGCRSLSRIDADAYRLSVAVSLGPVSLTFDGTVEIVASQRPSILILKGRGEGGLAGHAAGTARLKLSETASGVRLGFEIEAEPHGPLAALGTLFIRGVARALTDHFVATFAALVGDSRKHADLAAIRCEVKS